MLLAIALLSVSALAHEAVVGGGGTDILGDGIFETNGDAISFPVIADTNVDSVQIGNDKATAFGMGDGFPFGPRNGPARAQNNLEIKKNQRTGNCSPCDTYDEQGYYTGCTDACLTVNIEHIKVGNREALAFGSASATNNIKIVSNQD